MKITALKRLFLLFFIAVTLAGTLVSCKSASVPPPTTEIDTTVEKVVTIRDTVFKTQKDSSYYKAYIECINGKPVISDKPGKKPTKKPGKNLPAPNVDLDKDGQLNVDCKKEAEELFAQWKETYIKENRKERSSYPVPYKVPLTWWETFLMWVGKCALGGASLIILWVLYKLKK